METLDTVIACDVLEHVLAGPHGSDLKVKMELPPDISPADRLRLAEQEDHQRSYGGGLRRASRANRLLRYASDGIVFDRQCSLRTRCRPTGGKSFSRGRRDGQSRLNQTSD